MGRPTCKTCPYWYRNRVGSEAWGECHRRSPLPIVALLFSLPDVDETTKGTGRGLTSQFAPTNRNDWCGEHPDFLAWMNHERSKVPLGAIECGKSSTPLPVALRNNEISERDAEQLFAAAQARTFPDPAAIASKVFHVVTPTKRETAADREAPIKAAVSGESSPGNSPSSDSAPEMRSPGE